MIARILFSIGLVFGLTSCLKDAPQATPAAAPESLTLVGMVVDLAGNPAANVDVFIEQDREPSGATGANGIFTLTLSEEKLVHVTGTERNTRDAFYLYFESPTDASVIGVSDFIPLVERGERQVPTVVLKNAASVSGKVVVLQGATIAPAAGAIVRMGRVSGLTGADGGFTLRRIPAGKLMISASAPLRSEARQDIDMLVGEDKALEQPLVLFPELGVTGQFLLGKQAPLSELVAAGHPFARRFEVQTSRNVQFMRFHSDPVLLQSLPPRPVEALVEFDFPRDGGNVLYYQFFDDGLDKSDVYKLSVVLDQFGETSGFTIEDGSGKVTKRTVQLKVDVPAAAYRMRVAETREELMLRPWDAAQRTTFYTFELKRNPSTGELVSQTELRTIFLQFEDALGLLSPVYKASTQLEIFPLPTASLFKIENGLAESQNRLVRLDLTIPPNAAEMRIFEAGIDGSTQAIIGTGAPEASNDPRVRNTANLWLPVAPVMFFSFPSAGLKTLYVQFRSTDSLVSPVFSQVIRILPFQEADVGFAINGGAAASSTKHLTLSLTPPSGALHFRVTEGGGANSSSSIERAPWLTLVPEMLIESDDVGLRTFYMQFENVDGATSPVYQQSIFVDPFVSGAGDFVINAGAPVARDPLLVINILAPPSAVSMAVAEDRFPTNFSGEENPAWVALAPTSTLMVRGTGSKTVVVKFRDEEGIESDTVRHVVFFDPFPIDATLNGVVLDAGSTTTTNATVAAAFTWSSGVREMRFGLDPAALDTAPFVTVNANEIVAIPATPGIVKVYVQFRLASGETSPIFFDEIEKQ